MNITVLIDNIPHPKLNLCHEHGMSFYFEHEGQKWLFDVGASDGFYINAQELGIIIEDVDYLVISHGHADHAGGLGKFLDVNSKAKIYISSFTQNKTFYSCRRGKNRNISLDADLLQQHTDRFIFIDENTQVSEHVGLVCKFSKEYPIPKTNKTLFILESRKYKPDDFKHEIALTIDTPKGIIIFSGCSHNGILNILATCSNLYSKNILACIGGTHLVDSDTNNTFESENEIIQIGQNIKDYYPDMFLITGHCTGNNTISLLSDILKMKLKTFYTGIRLPAMELI